MYSVYLVDDEPFVVEELKILLDWPSVGFAVCGTSDDSSAAVARISDLRPDVAILDINMTGMNGLSLAARIREVSPDTIICFLSAYDRFDYAVKAIDVGAKAYLTKPVKAEQLTDFLLRVKAELDDRPARRTDQSDFLLSPRTGGKSEIVDDILDDIEKNYGEHLSLSDYAGRYHYTLSYLSTLFKRTTGYAFIEYLVRFRMNKAAEMLRAGNRVMKEIAWKVGYADYYQFSKIFKKYTGVSPSAYAREYEQPN